MHNGHRAATLLLHSIEQEQLWMERNRSGVSKPPNGTQFSGLQISEGKIIRMVSIGGNLIEEDMSTPVTGEDSYLAGRRASGTDRLH